MNETFPQRLRARLAEVRKILREAGPRERLSRDLRDYYSRETAREWVRDFENACWRGEDIAPAVWRCAERLCTPQGLASLRVRHSVARPAQ